jgi:hypothetical protein
MEWNGMESLNEYVENDAKKGLTAIPPIDTG